MTAFFAIAIPFEIPEHIQLEFQGLKLKQQSEPRGEYAARHPCRLL